MRVHVSSVATAASPASDTDTGNPVPGSNSVTDSARCHPAPVRVNVRDTRSPIMVADPTTLLTDVAVAGDVHGSSLIVIDTTSAALSPGP